MLKINLSISVISDRIVGSIIVIRRENRRGGKREQSIADTTTDDVYKTTKLSCFVFHFIVSRDPI